MKLRTEEEQRRYDPDHKWYPKTPSTLRPPQAVKAAAPLPEPKEPTTFAGWVMVNLLCSGLVMFITASEGQEGIAAGAFLWMLFSVIAFMVWEGKH